jgi:hypothetical protein
MAPFTSSVARFITTPHRFLTRGGATWQYNPPSTDNPAVLAEIAPAMHRKLRRQGAVLPLLCGLFVFALQCVERVYGKDGDWQGVIGSFDLAFCAVLGLVFALYVYSFRAIRRFPLHREVLYRRQHGKWRWER